MLRRRLGVDDAARRPHDERRRQSRSRRARCESAEVACAERAEVGVGGRRRCPLVLAKLRRDLVRRDDVCFREAPPKLAGDRRLVGRVAEGEQRADSHRLGSIRQRVELERHEHARPGPCARERRGSRRARRAAPDARRTAGRDGRGSAGGDGADARSRPWPRTPCVRPCARAERSSRSSCRARSARRRAPDGGRCSEHGLLLRRSCRHLCRQEPSSSSTASVNVPPTSMPRIATPRLYENAAARCRHCSADT